MLHSTYYCIHGIIICITLCRIHEILHVIWDSKPAVPRFLIRLKVSISICFDSYNGQWSSLVSGDSSLMFAVVPEWWCEMESEAAVSQIHTHTTTNTLGLEDSRVTHNWRPSICSVPSSCRHRLLILNTHKVKCWELLMIFIFVKALPKIWLKKYCSLCCLILN